VTLEGYFEYVIAAYLNISRPLGDKSGEILGLSIGWYSAFLCLFLFPAIWLLLLLLPDKRLKQKKFAQKYGAMFDQMR